MTIEEALRTADISDVANIPERHSEAIRTLAAAYRAKCEECEALQQFKAMIVQRIEALEDMDALAAKGAADAN